MTRNRAKELLPIIQAFADGKTIEYSEDRNNWEIAHSPTWKSRYYRTKPETKLRPWKPEEVPLGNVVKWKDARMNGDGRFVIMGCGDSFAQIGLQAYTLKEALRNFVMEDGSPCGVEETE
jgi:hypothetical protein